MAKPRNSGSVFRRGRIYWIKYYKDGRSFRESSESDDPDVAEKLLKRRFGEIVTGRFAGLGPERIQFKDLAEAVVEDYELNEKKSIKDVKQRLKLHVLPALGKVRAAEIGTSHLKRYIAARQQAGAARATINRELALIKRAFRLGLQSDPPTVVRVPHIPMLRENNTRRGFLDHEQYRALRDALPEPLRPLLAAGYYTGARVGELRSLQWSQVDLQGKSIQLNPGETKNDEGRTLPLYGELLEWMGIQKAIRDEKFPKCPYVFHRDGEPIKKFAAAWETATISCGLKGTLFHDLRRTAVRNMVRAGIPEKVAMAISGHKTRSVFDRYNIVSDRDIRDAATKLQAHLPSSGTISGTVTPDDGDNGTHPHRQDGSQAIVN